MLPLRLKLFLFFLPVLMAGFLLPITLASIVQKEWLVFQNPNMLNGIVYAVIFFVVATIVWYLLGNISKTIKHVIFVMSDKNYEKKHVRQPKLSDAYEIQELLLSARQIQKNIEKADIKLIKNQRMVRIGKIAEQIFHDIQSPLLGIQTAEKILAYSEENYGTEPARAHQLIKIAGKRIQDLVDDLLSGLLERSAKIDVFPVQDILYSALQEHEEMAGKNIMLDLDYPMKSIHLRGSKSLLQRAVSNIVKNAIEALKAHPRIKEGKRMKGKVILRALVNSHQQIEVHIKDNGPGIPKNLHASILKGGVTFGKTKGHGIGMQVVCDAVDAHKGKLSLFSTPGQGSTFIMQFPLYEEIKENGGFVLSYNKAHPIAVIDDEIIIREQWKALSVKNNIIINTYDSWESFANAMPTVLPDQTVVVDFHLHGLNGGIIIDRLQAAGFKNLIMMTADYWKPLIELEAEKRNVRLCPKPTPSIIFQPIEKKKYTVLVVDDDGSILTTWEYIQHDLDIEKLYTYANMEALSSSAQSIEFDKIDYAIIDKNFENSQYNSDDLIGYLKAKGVNKVVVASGEPDDKLKDTAWTIPPDYILSGKKLPESFELDFATV